MAYFQQFYNSVSYPIDTTDYPGLRISQLGAIHAICAHFTVRSTPAVVVLPTGSGKTAVLMVAPYVLRANRVLIITQSRFVRSQIATDFKLLRTLKHIHVLPENQVCPNVFENKTPIHSKDEWESLRQFDVVISIPNSASPAYHRIPSPPTDLFDLVLIDEAHHSPAPTWNAVIDAFPGSRCVLFTATPFRRDEKEIKGKYIYTYPIQRAFEDGIYGDMSYLPVEVKPGENPDIVLAKRTERVFEQDRMDGFSHVLMVRADTRSRADELATIYQRETQLHLEIVHSGLSQRTTESTVELLRQGNLDGVICVNMLGEGFDLPNLKIAALHSPHRSLAVTLQFLGRFARVNGPNLGEAKFLAIQDEIHEKMEELFQESEAWGGRIRTIGQSRIAEELHRREFFEEFQSHKNNRTESTIDELSLYSINVLNHVKVFRVFGNFLLNEHPELTGFVTERVWVNERDNTVVFLVREEINPIWVSTNLLNKIEHHLFVIYFDVRTNLLFICATNREETLYREIASIFIEGDGIKLSLDSINRVLRGYTDLELFNVGMRNRATGIVAESYRQMAGSAVHDAIDKTDGALYHRGHIFGKGQTPNGSSTIGLSSLSKIWRLEHTKIPELVNWCRQLAIDLDNPAPFLTGINLDHLDTGREVTMLPDEVILAADWDEHIYQDPPFLIYPRNNGEVARKSMLDCDLIIDKQITTSDHICVSLLLEDSITNLSFTLFPYPNLNYLDDSQPRFFIERGYRQFDLVKYLMDYPLQFYYADGSLLNGGQLFSAPDGEVFYDAENLITVIDWEADRVNIETEFGVCDKPLRSIHEWVCENLTNSNAQIVFYDHRPGECADFLAVNEDNERNLQISLYHCKSAGGHVPGDRISDIDQVCGQAIKSCQWRNKKILIRHVKDRIKSGSIFMKGDIESFINLVESYRRSELPLEIYIVQPGISKGNLTPKVSSILSAASQGIVAVGCGRLKMMCSS